MRVLLDTHSFLWAITDPDKMSPQALEILSNKSNQVFLSVASGWEIAIKSKLGKLSLPINIESYILKQIAIAAIDVLPIQMSHALHVYKLPLHHQDPFDRIIIAQSQLENLPIVTGDSTIARYPVRTLW